MCFLPTDLFYWVLYQQRQQNTTAVNLHIYPERTHWSHNHMFASSIAHKCENSWRLPLSSRERTHGRRQTMEHTGRGVFYLQNSARWWKKEKRRRMWLHSIPLALFVFGSAVLFARTKQSRFLFGSQSLTSEMRLLTRGRQREGKNAHSTARWCRREMREDQKAKEKESIRRCASFGTVSRVIQPT